MFICICPSHLHNWKGEIFMCIHRSQAPCAPTLRPMDQDVHPTPVMSSIKQNHRKKKEIMKTILSLSPALIPLLNLSTLSSLHLQHSLILLFSALINLKPPRSQGLATCSMDPSIHLELQLPETLHLVVFASLPS